MFENEYLNIKEASEWATSYLGKKVTPANITYLIQYGRIKKGENNGTTKISKKDLINYYSSYNGYRQINWKEKLGEDLNWALSFDQYTESETTKHVHRLHPYKGKFIPQLVEYFLDDHTDNFKKEAYFEKGDIILDPFAGSGTTLVQCNELGIHAIGIDVSPFNTLISNSKIAKYDFIKLNVEVNRVTTELVKYLKDSQILEFEEKLLKTLSEFNNKYFPSPDYKYNIQNNIINEEEYSSIKEKEFLPFFNRLQKNYNIESKTELDSSFLSKWYSEHIRNEIQYVFNEIKKISNKEIKMILCVILSRTIRSCRATTHSDLATLVEPISTTYYCSKHGKICKPIYSIIKWWKTYTKDTLNRLSFFNKLKTNTQQFCLTGDSRILDIHNELKKKNLKIFELVNNQKINGIFSSPPYVGLIDYHEQHAYAYDLFKFERKDELEIGSLFKGQGREAKESYIKGISEVLINCRKYLIKDFNVFLVANDKYNFYPTIAENAGMKIIKQFKRPVLNRTEKDKGAYSEIIFHLKNK